MEHSLVDVLLERLGKTELAGTDAWKAHAKVLKEMLEHHIKEEERGIFEELGEHFSDDQRVAMGADFAAKKDESRAPLSGRKPTALRLAVPWSEEEPQD